MSNVTKTDSLYTKQNKGRVALHYMGGVLELVDNDEKYYEFIDREFDGECKKHKNVFVCLHDSGPVGIGCLIDNNIKIKVIPHPIRMGYDQFLVQEITKIFPDSTIDKKA